MIPKRLVAAMAGVMMLSAAAMAQDRTPPGQAGEPSAASAQRESARRQVETLRMARLTETLKLDERTAAKFIPAITLIGQKRREQMAEHRQAINDIRRQFAGTTTDDKKLKTAVDRVFGSHREMMKLREREMETVRDSLTLEQQAHYIVFQQEFMQEVRDVMSGSPRPRRTFHGRVTPRKGAAVPDAPPEAK